jgi:hypothetical protein
VDIDARDQERESTALIVAASVGQTEAVEFLIAEGADLFYRNLDNETALDVARLSQHHPIVVILETAMQQAKAGTSVSPVPAEPDKPSGCEVWAEGDLFDAIKRGDDELVRQLLGQGADPGQRQDAMTALTVAAIWGHPQVATALLEAGVDVNAQNEDGGTALHGAVFFGRVDAVRVLMDYQVDVTISNDRGEKATDYVTRPFTKEIGGAVDFLAELITIDVRQNDVRKSLPEMASVLNVEGPQGLKNILLEDNDKLSRVFVEKLLSYALARRLTFRDREMLNLLYEQSADADYRLRDILLSIVSSEFFTRR